ncbi:hypothetical protein FQN49_004429 [Arthroderma sp. PD_2]|nr:hypothetical protein FQN49_004429 [Arthroderma sp. PD_2]
MASPVDNTPMLGFCSPNLNLHRPTSMKLYRSHSEGTVGMSANMGTRKSAPKPQRRETINVSVPVTYTPATHRISKAKKGKRVHACQFPGCSKVFTRAEHRRRHELNHNPQATFVCTINGCGKGFHRSDLLSRHIEKHEQESRPTKPTIGHKRRISQISDASEMAPMSSPSLAVPQSVPTSTQIPPPVTPELHSLQAAQSPFVNSQLLSPPYWTSFRRASDPAIGYSGVPYTGGDESSLFSSPECSRSPSSDGSHGSHFPFNTPHITGIGIFHEPMIDSTLMGTSLAYDPNFGGFQAFDSTATQSSPLVTLPAEGDSARTVVSFPFKLDGDEWLPLRRELTSSIGIVSANSGMGIIDPARWHDCLELYWRHFHPQFPIIHRPSFFTDRPNPLLVGTVVAIGSQYDTRSDSSIYSLVLLEACQTLLSKGKITSRSLVSDVQSSFLLELLSKYRSRRADVGISHRLKSLYGSFNQDSHWITQNPLSLASNLSKDNHLDVITRAHKFWVEHETRRRVLQAMFILDVHQSTLFQQPLSFFKPVPGDLPMPCTSDLWECTDLTAWADCAIKSEKSTTIATASFSLVPDADLFQSSLIMSYEILSHGEGSMENLRARHPCLHLLHHGLLAAQHSPLQALITVSNESWLFNRKVTDEAQFMAAKETLKAWVADTDAVKLAVWHAVRVLQCALDAQKAIHRPLPVALPPFITPQAEGLQPPNVNTFVSDSVPQASPFDTIPRPPLRTLPGPFTMLQANWAVYISTLICWAYGFGAPENSPSDHTMPHSYLTPADLYISTLLSLAPSWSDLTNDNIPTHIRRGTNGLLQNIRELIIFEGPSGGLLNEGELVLARLMEPSFPHHQMMWEF